MRAFPDLPPLQALRVFESVARLQSFRRAGEELCVTQSAVSYHIKALEADLQVLLFERHARGIRFTPEGAAFFETVQQAFGQVAEHGRALRGSATAGPLKVSVLPSFAAGWLVPRMARFAAQHPRVPVMLDPRLELVDLNRGEADLAIRFGRGDWPGLRCDLLVAERLVPVASPALLQQGPPVKAPQDLLHHTLLYPSRPDEWTLWAEAAGVDLSSARQLPLTDYNIVVQAALDGLGVAMGRQVVLANRLASGALMPLFDQTVDPPGLGYWICQPRQAARREAAVFADWLMREAIFGSSKNASSH